MIRSTMTDQKRTTLTTKYNIEPRHSAAAMGSGDMPVLATPALISFMENCAMLLAGDYTDDVSTTVGTMITTDHQHATPIGDVIEVTASLSSLEGRKMTFDIVASDATGVVAECTHERFVVSRQRFLERLGIKEEA